MPDAWKKLDLGGDGLQTINAHIAQQQRSLTTAYVLLAGFPLGLAWWYLHQPLRALPQIILSTASLATWLMLDGWWFALPLGLLIALLGMDAYTLEDAVVRHNKDVRIRNMLQKTRKPPKHFKGRYTDETDLSDYMRIKESERGGHAPVDMDSLQQEEFGNKPHVPSFNEQERMLREMIKQKKQDKSD